MTSSAISNMKPCSTEIDILVYSKFSTWRLWSSVALSLYLQMIFHNGMHPCTNAHSDFCISNLPHEFLVKSHWFTFIAWQKISQSWKLSSKRVAGNLSLLELMYQAFFLSPSPICKIEKKNAWLQVIFPQVVCYITHMKPISALVQHNGHN